MPVQKEHLDREGILRQTVRVEQQDAIQPLRWQLIPTTVLYIWGTIALVIGVARLGTVLDWWICTPIQSTASEASFTLIEAATWLFAGWACWKRMFGLAITVAVLAVAVYVVDFFVYFSHF
jgi:hypothetical protein